MGVELNPNGGLQRLTLLSSADRETLPRKPRTATDKTRHLRIFHFNDLHNNLLNTETDGSQTQIFAAMAGRVAEAKSAAGEDETVLFFGCGDDHTGSVFDELCGLGIQEFVCDPAYRLYCAAGVDAITLGNHDFDRGSARLRQSIEQDAHLPIFSANISGSKQLRLGEHYCDAAIAEVHGLRIGLFGLTTPTGIRTDLPEDPELSIGLAGPEALRQTRRLDEICDIIIILSHIEFAGPRAPWDFMSPRVEDYYLAAELEKLNGPPIIILGGHSHSILNQDGLDPAFQFENVWITQTGGNGRYLGEIELLLDITQDDVFVDRLNARLHATADLEMNTAAKTFHKHHVAPIWEMVRKTAGEHTATVSLDCEIADDPTLLDRYTGECALANFMTDAVMHRMTNTHGIELDFCLLNATALTAGLNPGPVLLGDWYDVMPYADDLVVVSMTGLQVREMLISNARRVLRAEEIAAGLLDGRRFLRRGFLHFSGALRYSLVLKSDATMATVMDVELLGQRLQDCLDDVFQVGVIAAIFEGGYGQNWNGTIIGPDVPGDIRGFDMKSLKGSYTCFPFRQEVIVRAKELGEIGPSTGAQLDGRVKLI